MRPSRRCPLSLRNLGLPLPLQNPRYQGARSLEDFVQFLEDKLASDYAVRVSSLDSLAVRFSGSEDKAGLLQQTEEAVAALAGEAGEKRGGMVKAGGGVRPDSRRACSAAAC